jgi:cytochrome c5
MRWFLFIALLVLGACSEPRVQEADTRSPDAAPVATESSGSDLAMQKWARSCALCHVNGEGGAPVTGDVEAWSPRLAKGRTVLLTSAVEGIGNMPPLGYCMSCEREDFEIMIDFMLGEGT